MDSIPVIRTRKSDALHISRKAWQAGAISWKEEGGSPGELQADDRVAERTLVAEQSDGCSASRLGDFDAVLFDESIGKSFRS